MNGDASRWLFAMTGARSHRRTAPASLWKAEPMFPEEIGRLLAVLRTLLELPTVTREQQVQVNEITDRLFAPSRQA